MTIFDMSEDMTIELQDAGPNPHGVGEIVEVPADEHIVSFTCLLVPGTITAVCTCGRLKQDCGGNPTHIELTNIASAHLVPGVTT